MSTRKSMLKLIQYNLKFIYPKILFILISFIIVITTVILTIRQEEFTSIDMIIYFFGGYNEGNAPIFNILISLFPCFMISMIVERFISDIYEIKSIYLLIRVKNKKVFLISYIISIAILVGIILVLLDVNIIISSKIVSNKTYLGSRAMNLIGYEPSIYPMWKIIINIFVTQFTGIYCISLLQLIAKKIFKYNSFGFIISIIIYILNISNYTLIGSHVLITKINVISDEWQGFDMGIYNIINLSITILIIVILVNESNITKRMKKHEKYYY